MSEHELLRVTKTGDDALAVTALELFLSSFSLMTRVSPGTRVASFPGPFLIFQTGLGTRLK